MGMLMAAAVAIAVRTGIPQNIMNGMLRNAPPADTKPEMTPIITPTANSGPVAGKLREAGGLRPSSIWVAPAKTITAKASARARCGRKPAAAVEANVPTTMPGTMRRATPQSTTPCL